jgi:hypothetical protein
MKFGLFQARARRAGRRAAYALAALLLAPLGCAPPRPPPLALHLALQSRRIAVVPAVHPVVDAVELFAEGRAAGAFQGAGRGAAEGLFALRGGSCQGEVCGAFLVLALATAVVGGAALGAVAGAVAATPEAEARRIEAVVHRCVEELPAHLDLSRRVIEAAGRQGAASLALVPAADPAAAAPDAARLRAQGFETALEIGVRRIAFVGGEGADPELALELVASARLVDTRTGTVEYARDFERVGAPRRFSAWSAGSAEALRHALFDGLQDLADDVVDVLFVQADLGIASGTWAFPGTRRSGSCWLTPTEPPNEYPFLARELTWIAVGSQPTLAWEPFPDEGQRAALRKATGHAPRDVRYALRIWSVRDDERGELVYERRDLSDATHRLERPLLPRRRYFWSIRACFGIDAGTACTPWASSLVPSRGGRTCESPEIPPWNYFRFRTR